MPDISTITLPDGNTYSFKDAEARQSGGTSYYRNFVSGDWSGSNDEYTMSIPAATHGCGSTPLVQVLRLSGSAYQVWEGYPSTGVKVSVAASGNITLSTATAFAGRVVVR